MALYIFTCACMASLEIQQFGASLFPFNTTMVVPTILSGRVKIFKHVCLTWLEGWTLLGYLKVLLCLFKLLNDI